MVESTDAVRDHLVRVLTGKMTADHSAYHVGQLVVLRRAPGIWRAK